MNNQPPDIPPQRPGYGPPPPPPPPPGYGGGPPPGYGGPQAGYGGPPPGYGGPPPNQRPWLPWALGCGGCGLLIVLALVFFGAIGYFAERQERARGVMSDTTAITDTTAVFGDESDGDGDTDVSGDDTIPVIQPLDTETSSDEVQPSDGPSSDLGNKPGLQEIRPVDP